MTEEAAYSPPAFSFEWRRDEHAAVTAFLVREQSREGVWRALRLTVFAFLVLAGAVVVAAALLGDLTSFLQLGVLTLVTSGVFFGFPSLVGRLQAWRVARSDPNVGHGIRHSFSDSGLTVDMKTLTAQLRWSGMYAVRETETMLLFYYNRRRAYYLPKRVLGEGEDITPLTGWIEDRLPGDVPFLHLDAAEWA
ncbi:MAG: YcxB family protein [Gemmatimonadetes bacterium]|nr:YcxB family protein [Gemmatimonadota bacterium]NNM04743.1 YcxB family protein [Gemmatimonadota bacterium]